MTGGRYWIQFGLLTVIYWIVVSVVVTFVPLRTCGMTPDAVALCDLQPIRRASMLALVGYFIFGIIIRRFLRSR